MSKRALLLSLLLALLIGPLAVIAQDVIYKTDGGRLRGKIVKETRRSVTIETYGGRITVPKGEIARMERDGDVFRDFERKRDKLSRHDAEGWYELGTWCQDRGMHPQAIDCFHETIRIDREHEDARWELGYRRYRGQWVTQREYYTARGYVEFDGRWVTESEKEKLEQGLVRRDDGSWGMPEDEDEEQVARAPRRPQPARPKPASAGRSSGNSRSGGAKRDGDRGRQGPAAGNGFGGGGAPLGGQVGLPPLSDEERAAQLAQGKQAGGWKVGYSSKYYDVYSNGKLDEVKKLAAVMDKMCDEYVSIFKFEHAITRPFPIHIYASQQEFMSRTGMGQGTGGFYDGKKIVAFHGSLGSLNTQSVLFHEGTHQFQGLVMGRNMWRAKIWLIEGLAVFFEASEVQGRRLRTGAIPAGRLANVKRAINSGSYVRLRDLIRMDQAQFGAIHYAHAWSLIYFLVNGTKGGKKRFVQYWEEVKNGHPDQVKLFEELFNKPIEEIEAAWKDYVKQLSAR
jgi:RNase P/RNase MRP subunit p29